MSLLPIASLACGDSGSDAEPTEPGAFGSVCSPTSGCIVGLDCLDGVCKGQTRISLLVPDLNLLDEKGRYSENVDLIDDHYSMALRFEAEPVTIVP